MERLIVFLTCPNKEMKQLIVTLFSKGNQTRYITENYIVSDIDKDFRRDSFDELPVEQKTSRIRNSITRMIDTKAHDIFVIDLESVSNEAIGHYSFIGKTKEGCTLVPLTISATQYDPEKSKFFLFIQNGDFESLQVALKKSEALLEGIKASDDVEETLASFIASIKKEPPLMIFNYQESFVPPFDMDMYKRIAHNEGFNVLTFKSEEVELRDPVVTFNGKRLPSDPNAGSIFRLVLRGNWKELKRRVIG